MNDPRTPGWQRGPNIRGDDDEDTALLREMYKKAVKYITSKSWSQPINDIYLAFGVGGVIALFFVCFARPVGYRDDKLWVVVGDLPTAYFVLDDARDAASAIKVYCELMSGWADSVLEGRSLDDVFPVDAAPTKANAEQLKDRIRLLEEQIVPTIQLANE